MQPQITGRKVEITEAIKQYIFTKFEKLERHFDQITSAHFILGIENVTHMAEARILIPGHEVFVQNSDENMYAAIDILVDKLDRQIIKFKDKMKDHKNAPHHQIDCLPKDDDDDMEDDE